jgi:phosphoribosyl-ATP pyrophosphohydrolase
MSVRDPGAVRKGGAFLRGRLSLTLRYAPSTYGCMVGGMADSIDRLYQAVLDLKKGDPSRSRTARLLRAGRAKMAKKLAEEAVEVVIDAMHGDRDAVIRESADLIYNLVVLWAAAGVRPQDVWKEMDRRERLMGLAEKLPKTPAGDAPRRKVVALDARRSHKRR